MNSVDENHLTTPDPMASRGARAVSECHIGQRAVPFVGFLVATALAASPIHSQTAEPSLLIELNRIDQVGEACRLTFLVDNRSGADVTAISLETVMLDVDGVVDRLTIFDFGALPDSVPRVRQFDLPDLSCDALGRVLVNGVADCDPALACTARLEFSTRTEVEVIG